jgi:hypothetical protein
MPKRWLAIDHRIQEAEAGCLAACVQMALAHLGISLSHRDENLTSISKAQTIEEIGAFWDEHSLADYWDQTREVEFEVRAQRRRGCLLPSVRSEVQILSPHQTRNPVPGRDRVPLHFTKG